LGIGAARSCEGDAEKISDKVMEDEVGGLHIPLPNLKGGRRLSAAGFGGKLDAGRPLTRERFGRSGTGFLRLRYNQQVS